MNDRVNNKAMEEIRDAIRFYDERGSDWVSVVTFIGITHLFGGWEKLVASLRTRIGWHEPR